MTTDCIVSGLQLGIVWHRPWVLILTRHRDTISIASCYIRYYCECAKCTEESSKTFHLRKWRSHIHHLHEEYAPQAPDRLKVQTCGIIQKLYETRHIETMTFGKSVIAHISKMFQRVNIKHSATETFDICQICHGPFFKDRA